MRPLTADGESIRNMKCGSGAYNGILRTLLLKERLFIKITAELLHMPIYAYVHICPFPWPFLLPFLIRISNHALFLKFNDAISQVMIDLTSNKVHQTLSNNRWIRFWFMSFNHPLIWSVTVCHPFQLLPSSPEE